MSYLIDTNVLMRSLFPAHPQHQVSRDAFNALRRQGEELILVPQNYYEFWVVATRPASENGLGFTVAEAIKEFKKMRTHFKTVTDTPAILDAWETVVTKHGVMGKNGHDARFVAAMLIHGISHFLTFNMKDFQRYTEITVQTPQDILSQSASN